MTKTEASKSAAHTPGPWRIVPNELSTVEIRGKGNLTIAEVVDTSIEDEANARLIAAAPELLGALEVALRYLRAKNFDAGGRDAVAFVLETAIAKATGSAQ